MHAQTTVMCCNFLFYNDLPKVIGFPCMETNFLTIPDPDKSLENFLTVIQIIEGELSENGKFFSYLVYPAIQHC